MNCRIGDLAIVVRAQLPSNIGCIVAVIADDDGRGVRFTDEGKIWKVTCSQPMTWLEDGKPIHQKTGPVPDNRLRPIRGLRPPRSGPSVVAVDEKIAA